MKNAGKACNNRLYRHIRTFEKIVKNYFVIFLTLFAFFSRSDDVFRLDVGATETLLEHLRAPFFVARGAASCATLCAVFTEFCVDCQQFFAAIRAENFHFCGLLCIISCVYLSS